MLKTRIVILTAVIVPLLTSCGYVVRESGFTVWDWPKHSYYTPRAIQISSGPQIEIGSSCDGTNYTATFGPYIGLPLFVIPNPLWPFTYYYHNTKNADITLSITDYRKNVDWNAISINLFLNGKPLGLDHVDDVSDSTKQSRRYIYKSGLKCKAFDASAVKIVTDGSVQISKELIYKHRWRADFQGI